MFFSCKKMRAFDSVVFFGNPISKNTTLRNLKFIQANP